MSRDYDDGNWKLWCENQDLLLLTMFGAIVGVLYMPT